MSDNNTSVDNVALPIKRTEGETLRERLTDNAYENILPARYLRKDANGDLIETQEDLFVRVANNIALAEAVYEAEKRDVEITVTPDQLKPDHPRRNELAEEVFGAGVTPEDDTETTLSVYNVNKFAYETIVPELPPEIAAAVEGRAREFREMMEDLSFMPNSPTLMNAGDELQQLSACFVDSPADDITDIHQTMKEAAEVFQCLTEDTHAYVEGKGLVSIKDVEPGDRIQGRGGDNHQTRLVEETHAYDDAPIHSVVTSVGIELTGTPNHELLVNGDWQRIDEIQPGNILSLRLGWLPDVEEEIELSTSARGAQLADNRGVSNDAIANLVAAGYSDNEIAEQLDCSSSTVRRRRAHELELPPNGNGGRKPGDVNFDRDAFRNGDDAGLSDREIADESGISTRSVCRYRNQHSLDSNGRAVTSVRQPTSLTIELAELVGMWIGDGSLHENGIRFRLRREETLEHADRLCRDLFDEGLDWQWSEGCYDAVLHSHEIKRFWVENFGGEEPDATNASVPPAVRQSGHDVIAGFLRGLYSTDGSLQNSAYPRLRSSSDALVDEVQQLLIGLGIPAVSWEDHAEERDYYTVGPTGERGLEGFADLIGFLDERYEEMRTALTEIDHTGTTVGKITDSTWEVPVERVDDAGTDVVYDVTVADEPEYLADSVVSHNSGGGMGYAFWKLRPYGDSVGSTGGIASGPITFMRTFDQMCFVPGTKILTPDGQTPIEELEPGQLVIDENGDAQPVTETMERYVDEDIVEVTPERINKPLRVTDEHPFKVVRGDGFEWVDAGDLQMGDRIVLGHNAERNGISIDETIDLAEISTGALVFSDGGVTVNREYYGASKGPKPNQFNREVPTTDLATIAGWYFAEGSIRYQRGIPSTVTFTLNSDEHAAAESIRGALESFGVQSRIREIPDRNTLHVHAEQTSFAEFMANTFGTGAAEKTVPSFLWNAHPEMQARVIESLFAGDGKLEKRGQSQRAHLKLVNEEIIDFVFQAGLRCGVQFSRHDRTPDDRHPTYAVSASVSTAMGTPLERLFDSIPSDFSPRDRTYQDNGHEVVKVASVDRTAYEGPVYNAEVAGTHTYVAEDVVVHNCETIAQGGARRGAQMGVMRISHPDVIQFIHSKNKDVSLAHSLRLNDPDDYTHNSFKEALAEARELIDEEGRVPKHLRNAVEGHLSNFNISVGVTDDFMEALYNDEEFTFTNPRTEEPHVATPETKELYEMFDLGEYVDVGEVLSVPAGELWEHIIQGAHENGEPGVIYLERVNKQHSFDVDIHSSHRILATNPCGEQPLEEYEACNLGHINLSTLADMEAPDWRVWSDAHQDEYETHEAAVEAFLEEAVDFEEFDYRIDRGTRFLENVVTMSDFPVDEIEQKVRDMRKIGLGVMGLAQLYIQLGVRYGSDVGNEIARQLMIHINHTSKWTSHELATERDVFTDWADSKYANPTEYGEWFEHHTGLDPEEWEDGFPIRNHNTTTIAPTGTTSMLGNTTGGCEPIYNVAYYKNVSDDVQGDEMLVEFDDYFLRTLEANDIDVTAVKREAQEQMAENEFDGVEGLSTVPNAIGELFVVTGDLSGKEHAAVQCACQEGVDSAISKTCNFPNDATIGEMDEVYRYIYDNGGKGVTVYRDGTRSKQVLTTRAKNTDFADESEAAEALVEGIQEVFGGFESFIENEDVQAALDAEIEEILTAVDTGPEAYAERRARPDSLTGVTQRIDTGYGKMYVTINEDENGEPFELFANIGHSGGFTNSFTEALAKVISTALRSAVDPREIVDELQGTRSPKVAWDKGEQIQSIPDAIGTAMRRYLDNDIEKAHPQQERLEEAAERASQSDVLPDEPEIESGDAAVMTEEAAGSDDTTQALIDAGESPECPECGSMSLYFSEGCKTCEACGWSEC